jgi:hypothetical protein
VASILGPGVASGYVNLTENWTLRFNASEGYRHFSANCSQPYRTTYFYGCWGQSNFSISARLWVWDATYRNGTIPAWTGWSTLHFKQTCSTWGPYCPFGRNWTIVTQKTLILHVNPLLISSHTYYLATKISGSVFVELLGWKGIGLARINLATGGGEAKLTSLAQGP